MKGKGVRLPHTLILIYVMVVLTVIATWIVPGGEYKRVEKRLSGRTVPVPVPGSYAAGRGPAAGARRPVRLPGQGLRRGGDDHRHRLHLRRRVQRHPEDRGHHRRHPQPVAGLRTEEGPAPAVHSRDHDHLLPGRRHLGHVRGDHALHPHLRPAGPVARLRHHRRRRPALHRRRVRLRRRFLQSVHGRHRPGHRRAASLFGPRLPAHRLGGRDGHRHRRGHALRRPGPQGPDRSARPTKTTWRRSGSSMSTSP